MISLFSTSNGLKSSSDSCHREAPLYQPSSTLRNDQRVNPAGVTFVAEVGRLNLMPCCVNGKPHLIAASLTFFAFVSSSFTRWASNASVALPLHLSCFSPARSRRWCLPTRSGNVLFPCLSMLDSLCYLPGDLFGAFLVAWCEVRGNQEEVPVLNRNAAALPVGGMIACRYCQCILLLINSVMPQLLCVSGFLFHPAPRLVWMPSCFNRLCPGSLLRPNPASPSPSSNEMSLNFVDLLVECHPNHEQDCCCPFRLRPVHWTLLVAKSAAAAGHHHHAGGIATNKRWPVTRVFL